MTDTLRVLCVRQHSDKYICVLSELFDFFPKDDIMLLGFFCLRSIDIESVHLMSFFDEVDCHGEAHVAQSDEAYFRDGEEGFADKFHQAKYIYFQQLLQY